MAKRKVDLVVISDVHLGTYGSRAEELYRYLKSIKPETLVLNGDIIDIWQFRKRYFPKSHLKVLKQIISMASKGTEVHYLTGNHDEFLRRFSDLKMGNINLADKLLLPLAEGKAWFFHGDIFDASIQSAKWLAKFGGWSYDLLIRFNSIVNWFLRNLGKEPYSFSKKIKNSVKKALSHIQSFEDAAAELAIEQGYKYVICGHIHQPQLREMINDKGTCVYLNSGDWIENLTALEYNKGLWQLYRYENMIVTEVETEQEGELNDLNLERILKRYWPMKKASGSKAKVLYAFQGTGNGHASRALELIPHLQKHCELKVLCSGSNSQLDLGFPLDYHFNGISFSYNKQGGLSYWQSFRNARFLRFKKEVDQLDISTFDLILNDFEPVSAYAAKKSKIPLIGLSHQAAFLSPKTPRPQAKNFFAEWVFRNYAPCNKATAFHFEAYDDFIQYPILRSKVQNLKVSNGSKYLVYLPAYNEQLLKQLLSQVKEAEWLIFSKECKEDYRYQNLEFREIDGESFLSELAAAKGLLCSAGFEAPAEALYLKKKLFVIPINGQYEQDCNAEALKLKGVPSAKTLNKESLSALKKWVSNPQQLAPQKITAAEDLIISILKEIG